MSEKPDPNDPTTWPVADAVPTDVFLGSITEDCTPLATETKAKPAPPVAAALAEPPRRPTPD